jgi:hypothetical protein
MFCKVKLKLSLYLTEHHAMKGYWRSVGVASRILDLGTRWRWVVNFTPRPLYPQGKSPRFRYIYIIYVRHMLDVDRHVKCIGGIGVCVCPFFFPCFVMSCVSRNVAVGRNTTKDFIVSELILNRSRPGSLICEGWNFYEDMYGGITCMQYIHILYKH